MEKRATVVIAHEAPDGAALVIKVGDRVAVGERATHWTAFVFVTGDQGSGWVPERYLTSERPLARVTTGYDTQELSASEGSVLTVVVEDPESEWTRCRDNAGTEGWIPNETIRLG